jgi:hypothetical protein
LAPNSVVGSRSACTFAGIVLADDGSRSIRISARPCREDTLRTVPTRTPRTETFEPGSIRSPDRPASTVTRTPGSTSPL